MNLKSLRLKSLDPRTGEPPTQQTAAHLMAVTETTFARWERGDTPMPRSMQRLARFVLGREIDIGLLDDE